MSLQKCYPTFTKTQDIEPKLTIIGEELDSRTGTTTNEARLDIRAYGVWEIRQQAFLDLRVSAPALNTVSTSRCNSVT